MGGEHPQTELQAAGSLRIEGLRRLYNLQMPLPPANMDPHTATRLETTVISPRFLCKLPGSLEALRSEAWQSRKPSSVDITYTPDNDPTLSVCNPYTANLPEKPCCMYIPGIPLKNRNSSPLYYPLYRPVFGVGTIAHIRPYIRTLVYPPGT